MMRIQSFRMGYAGLEKPIIQNPGLRGLFNFQAPSADFSLAAGSPSGGGADASAAAPSPGAPAATPVAVPAPATQAIFVPTPTYLFPVQEPIPAMPLQPVREEAPAIPTWAIVGGSLAIGAGIAALLLKKG